MTGTDPERESAAGQLAAPAPPRSPARAGCRSSLLSTIVEQPDPLGDRGGRRQRGQRRQGARLQVVGDAQLVEPGGLDPAAPVRPGRRVGDQAGDAEARSHQLASRAGRPSMLSAFFSAQ